MQVTCTWRLSQLLWLTLVINIQAHSNWGCLLLITIVDNLKQAHIFFLTTTYLFRRIKFFCCKWQFSLPPIAMNFEVIHRICPKTKTVSVLISHNKKTWKPDTLIFFLTNNTMIKQYFDTIIGFFTIDTIFIQVKTTVTTFWNNFLQAIKRKTKFSLKWNNKHYSRLS